MRDETGCSDELLCGLVDDELDVNEKRMAALHASVCPRCAQSLGQLFAARAVLSLPAPEKVTLPRAFWRHVRERLDNVDGLIRATEVVPRRRPLVARWVPVAGLAVVALAFGARAFFAQPPEIPTQLSRYHLQASYMPGDPGLHQAVGYGVRNTWRPVSRSLIDMNGVMVLQTIYSVGGLPVSVFRVPEGSFDTRHLAPERLGNQTVYLAASNRSTMVAIPNEGAWDIVVTRSPLDETMAMARSYPRSWPVE